MEFKQLPIPLPLQALKDPPHQLFFRGDLKLLEYRKIAIVGTRKPNPYAKLFTQKLADLIAKSGGVVISGGALGIDIIAHSSAFPHTIMVAPTDLLHCYPHTNKTVIQKIYQNSLALSEYANNPKPKPYHFLQRNRIVIGLSDAVIIPQADLESGSMESAKIALKLQKPLFVLPHRIGESEGTNSLIAKNQAKIIFDPQDWIIEQFGTLPMQKEDELIEFCLKMPSFEEAYERFGDRLYEYEIEGKIERRNGKIYVL